MDRCRLKLVTGRSLGQGRGKEEGKFSKTYIENVCICEFDPDDAEKLNIKPDDVVEVSSRYGSTRVKARVLSYPSHPGIIFIPYGPWANSLTSPSTGGSGMPDFKGLEVDVEKVEGGVEPLDEIIEEARKVE